MMKHRTDTFLLTIIVATVCVTGQLPLRAAIVYSNDFNAGAASLTGFTIGGTGSAGSYSVSVVNGQLEIDTQSPLSTSGYAAINNSLFAAPYSSTLKNNPGLVTWAFNVSNQDGAYNNLFFFGLASSAPDATHYPVSSYFLNGGGNVGNRMILYRVALGVPIVADVPNGHGLDTLPTKGSIRITYEPSTDLWCIYGSFGLSYVDPITVTNLLASGVDGAYTSIPLPYMTLGGQTTGCDYFDNLTVSVVPEPATWSLLALGTGLLLSSLQLRLRLS